MGDVVRLGDRGERRRIPAPPAPNCLEGGRSKTWGELLDHLQFRLDNGEYGRLHQLLEQYRLATFDVPLPTDVFDTGEEEG